MTKRLVITSIAVPVGALQLFKGESYQGPFPVLVNGYLIDFLLPTALFLLLGLFLNKTLHSAIFRAGAVLAFGDFVEASQYFGHPVPGSTFDPLDILAYTGGVALGGVLDLVIFRRLIPRWREQERQP